MIGSEYLQYVLFLMEKYVIDEMGGDRIKRRILDEDNWEGERERRSG